MYAELLSVGSMRRHKREAQSLFWQVAQRTIQSATSLSRRIKLHTQNKEKSTCGRKSAGKSFFCFVLTFLVWQLKLFVSSAVEKNNLGLLQISFFDKHGQILCDKDPSLDIWSAIMEVLWQ